MVRLKLRDKFYKIIDGYRVNESSREVKFNSLKLDFTDKTIADLPLKYQECNLVEGEFRHIDEEEGSYATGNNMQVIANGTKRSELSALMGDTKQNGTPTPDTPVAIDTVTGGQVISVIGKNLWGDLPIFTRTNAGYTATQNEDGTITLSGTSTTSGGSITFQQAVDNGMYKKLEAGTYTISCDMATNNIWIQAYDITNSSSSLAVARSSTGASFTLTEEANVFIRIWISASGVVTDGTYKIQLEKGIKTSYEPYKSQTYEINLGKNLLNLTNGTYSSNGITALVENGKITLNGTATANSFLTIPFVYQYDGTYTISANNEEIIGSTTASGTYASVRIDDNTDTQAIMGSKNATKTFTLNQKYNDFKIRTGQGLTYDNFVIYPQLEKGSQATSYSAYKTPIELCKIGNYQDFIKRGTGKNLFDISQSINAYINSSGETITGTSTNLLTDYIKVSPNKKYTISLNTQFDNIGYALFDGSKTYVSRENNYNKTTLTITMPNNIEYMRVWFNKDNASAMTIENTIVYQPMIEEGSAATPYEPYGMYNKWYIEKQVGKKIYNGSESWAISNGVFYRTEATALPIANKITALSNYFVGGTNQPSTTTVSNYNPDNSICISSNTSTHRIYIKTSVETTVANLKTWLSNNNVTVYYVLKNPTYEEITDTELINQLESIELYNGTNNIMVSGYLPSPITIHYNFQIEEDIERVDGIIYTGYVNSFILPNMKNRHEYRELELDLLSPLAMATVRTVDAIGTYELQSLVRELIQPLIDDGFVLKQLNIPNNQISVNFLSETVESSLNKLSNKYNFWWYIDVNKNIYINSISYLMGLAPRLTYDDENTIKGLIDVIPSIDATDYCNVVNFSNMRLYTKSHYYLNEDEDNQYSYYNPITKVETINSGDEIEFDIPFDTNLSKYLLTIEKEDISDNVVFAAYFKTEGSYYYTTIYMRIDNGKLVLSDNLSISDSYSEDNDFVFVRDSFFNNLIVGMKYNGNQTLIVKEIKLINALMMSKVKVIDNEEVAKNKGIITESGIVEKQIDMDEQWKTYEELLEIASSYFKKNTPIADTIKLNVDYDSGLNVGNTINVNKDCFLINGTYIITDKSSIYNDNVKRWEYTLKNANILENYVDLFRATEQESSDEEKLYLVTANNSDDGGMKETYEVIEV